MTRRTNSLYFATLRRPAQRRSDERPTAPERASLVRSHVCALLGGAMIVMLVGCVSIPPGYAAREWSRTMREMQIVAVFPPREGVQPGDLYFVSTDQPDADEERDAAEGDFLPIGTWVGRVDLRHALHLQYQREISFPETPTATSVAAAKKQDETYLQLPVKDALYGGEDPDATGDTNRPRLVGFPDFAAATFSKGDLSALVPVQALNIAAAAGFEASKQVTMSIPVAEYYGVPASVALHGLLGEGTAIADSSDLNLIQARNLLGPETDEKNDRVVVLRLITEVYMTRAIDIGVHGARSRGAQLAVKPAGTGAETGTATDTGAAAETPKAADSSGADADPVALANQLNSQLETSMGQLQTPGGSLRFVSAGTSSVSMRRVFERPVAIGYRAVQLRVKLGMVGDTPTLYVSGFSAMRSSSDEGGWIPTGGEELAPTKANAIAPVSPPTSKKETDIPLDGDQPKPDK